jgi:hypothetical protein
VITGATVPLNSNFPLGFVLPVMALPRATFLMNLSTKPGEFCEMPNRIYNELYSKMKKK